VRQLGLASLKIPLTEYAAATTSQAPQYKIDGISKRRTRRRTRSGSSPGTSTLAKINQPT
jgi:hypothetical protein